MKSLVRITNVKRTVSTVTKLIVHLLGARLANLYKKYSRCFLSIKTGGKTVRLGTLWGCAKNSGVCKILGRE